MNPREQAEETITYLRDALRAGEKYVEGPPGEPGSTGEFIARCADRIDTDGAAQYYDAETKQMKFETMSVDALYTYVEEELLDAANYLYMLEARGGPYLENFVRHLFELWQALEEARNDEDEIITTEIEAKGWHK